MQQGIIMTAHVPPSVETMGLPMKADFPNIGRFSDLRIIEDARHVSKLALYGEQFARSLLPAPRPPKTCALHQTLDF